MQKELHHLSLNVLEAEMVLLLATLLALGDSGVSLLLPGSFHNDEVPADISRRWHALCHTGSSWELTEVKVSVEAVHDPLLDRGKETTGWLISTSCADPLLFVNSDAGVFESGEVTPVLTMTGLMSPGSFFHLGEDEFISVDGTGVYYNSNGISQRLSDVYENLYGEGVSIVWAGDLDGDGLTDIILDDCPHYAIYAGYRLFLSTCAETGELLGEVAEFMAISC